MAWIETYCKHHWSYELWDSPFKITLLFRCVSLQEKGGFVQRKSVRSSLPVELVTLHFRVSSEGHKLHHPPLPRINKASRLFSNTCSIPVINTVHQQFVNNFLLSVFSLTGMQRSQCTHFPVPRPNLAPSLLSHTHLCGK